jgi:hypothetical protein
MPDAWHPCECASAFHPPTSPSARSPPAPPPAPLCCRWAPAPGLYTIAKALRHHKVLQELDLAIRDPMISAPSWQQPQLSTMPALTTFRLDTPTSLESWTGTQVGWRWGLALGAGCWGWRWPSGHELGAGRGGRGSRRARQLHCLLFS